MVEFTHLKLRFYNRDANKLKDIDAITGIKFSDKTGEIQEKAAKTPVLDEFAAIQFDNLLRLAEGRVDEKTPPELTPEQLAGVRTWREVWMALAGLDPKEGVSTGRMLTRSMSFEGGVDLYTRMNDISFIACHWDRQRGEERQVPGMHCHLLSPGDLDFRRSQEEDVCFFNEETQEAECGTRGTLQEEERTYPYKLLRGITNNQELERFQEGQKALEEFAQLYETGWEELHDKVAAPLPERWATEERITDVVNEELRKWRDMGFKEAFLRKIRGKHRPFD